MSWFQLDPPRHAARHRATPGSPAPLSLAGYLLTGAVGFTLTSIAGFLPWAGFGHYLHPLVGEAGMYSACALVFMALTGLLMHRLIIGPGSLWRFYALFTPAFAAYAVIWMVCAMSWRGDLGGLLGLLGGTAVMGLCFAFAFDALRWSVPILLGLFLGNAAGYFGGGWLEEHLITYHRLAAMLAWGAAYGLGFGLGLGFAFYLCQCEARARLRELPSN